MQLSYVLQIGNIVGWTMQRSERSLNINKILELSQWVKNIRNNTERDDRVASSKDNCPGESLLWPAMYNSSKLSILPNPSTTEILG